MDPSDKQAAKYRSKNLMGYIQDKVDVGMTKLRSDEGVALDVAVLKATLQDEVVPKEKHVRTLKIASAGSAPRQQVGGTSLGSGLKKCTVAHLNPTLFTQLHHTAQEFYSHIVHDSCVTSLCGGSITLTVRVWHVH
jgi:hypothetical protein